jgi:exodeoxyribonuclease V alpha subunit
VQHAGGLVSYPRGAWGKEVVLGYALTCHATQGSGWKVACYLVDDAYINDRNLLYTAMSRPREILFTVGSMNVMEQQVQVCKLDERKTLLCDLYKGAV